MTTEDLYEDIKKSISKFAAQEIKSGSSDLTAVSTMIGVLEVIKAEMMFVANKHHEKQQCQQ